MTDIPGATASTYTLVSADLGQNVTVQVTATNTAGSANATAVAVGPINSAEAAAFLARTSGLDTTHTNAYTALINGLVTDGVWAKLDVLHIYATQNSTTANLNLVSTSYPATPASSPAFTTDRGYTGGAGTGTANVHTGFTPSTAVSPKFTLNSSHISLWSLTNASTSQALIMGGNDTGGANNTGMHAWWSADGNSYYYVNENTNIGAAGSSSTGHFIANRTSSSTVQGCKNGSVIVTGSAASQGLSTHEIFVAGQNNNGTSWGSPYQIAMASIGSSLSSTDVTNFYSRLRTYMTSIGVP